MYYCDIFQSARPHHWARAIKLSIAGFRHQCQRRGAIFVAMDRWMMAFQYCDSSLQIATLCLCAFYCWGPTTPRISNFMTDFRLVTSAVVCLPTCLSVVLFPWTVYCTFSTLAHSAWSLHWCNSPCWSFLTSYQDLLSASAFRSPARGLRTEIRKSTVWDVSKRFNPTPVKRLGIVQYLFIYIVPTLSFST